MDTDTDRTSTQACIVFDHAAIRRSGRLIWSEGTFTIPSGTVTAIVGTNGTGKTSMMQAELGLLPLDAGSLRVLGQPAGQANDRIGYVPQSYTSDIDSNLTAEQSVLLGLTGTRFGIHPVTRVVAHDLNMLLPVLTGAVYLLDGHPHYARMDDVLDSDLLTHLYGTKVEVVTTPQGDMFVAPDMDEPIGPVHNRYQPSQVARLHGTDQERNS